MSEDETETTEDTSNAEPGPGHNGVDGDKLSAFVERAENLQGDIDATMDEAKKECQPYRDDIKELKKEVAKAGFPKREFGAVLKARRLARQAEGVRTKLDDNQKDLYDLMRHALGDLAELPLGQAALDEAA